MDPMSLAAFNERAAQSEARLAQLEAQLKGYTATAGQQGADALVCLRATLLEARKEAVEVRGL